MTAFNIEHISDLPECIYVEIANRFNLAIERTPTGLSVRVYPKTNGELWDYPFTVFEVSEAEIAALEQEMEE